MCWPATAHHRAVRPERSARERSVRGSLSRNSREHLAPNMQAMASGVSPSSVSAFTFMPGYARSRLTILPRSQKHALCRMVCFLKKNGKFRSNPASSACRSRAVKYSMSFCSRPPSRSRRMSNVASRIAQRSLIVRVAGGESLRCFSSRRDKFVLIYLFRLLAIFLDIRSLPQTGTLRKGCTIPSLTIANQEILSFP